ncbi:seizure protein 6 homolog [Ptychodera flava]|uniref:seizure protein 6 homolog n=1 Tax=Ptychodera flava TaxID=63121 RepID=UPI00396A7696
MTRPMKDIEMAFYDDACVTQNLTVILSANYPSDYPHNLDCVWRIHLPQGRRIHLRFMDFYVGKKYDKLPVLIGEDSDPDSDDYVGCSGDQWENFSFGQLRQSFGSLQLPGGLATLINDTTVHFCRFENVAGEPELRYPGLLKHMKIWSGVWLSMVNM